MVSRFRYLAGGLLIATATAISVPGDAFAQSPGAGKECYVPRFSGAGSGAGAVAFMQVVNNGKGCSVRLTNNGQPALGVTVVEQPAHGAVAVNANQFSYTPAPGYIGQDTFRVISDQPSMKVKVQATVLQTAPSS